METKNWLRIEELFHDAMQVDAAARAAHLVEACGGDDALRREVESLVDAFESGGSFIDQPAFSIGMRVLSNGPAGALAGRAINHYMVIKLLGQGGMGEVYLARDSKLERLVALKFLGHGFLSDQWAREQLLKEARVVAQLENQNICAVYGIDETEGRDFIVMQYAEGETLAALMRRGPLPLARVLDIAKQLVCALSAAHERGVVHRDIKPQNIMVTPSGQIKVLDFGLAKFVQQKHASERAGVASVPAQTEVVAGTMAYMSPEQAQGSELDCRSDIFSFGIVLYEMFAGRSPFLRETEDETIKAVKAEDPTFADLPTGIPAGLLRILRKCLDKERARRYETAEQLLRDILDLQKNQQRAHPLRGGAARPLRERLGRYVAALAAAALLIAFSAAFVSYRLSKVHMLAILPVSNGTDDPGADYISEGLTESLIEKFSSLPRVRVRPPTVVALYGGKQTDPVRAGRELKVDAVLVSELIKGGKSLQLRCYLFDAAEGSQLWGQTFEVKESELLTLQDELTRKVTSSLNLWFIGDDKKLVAKRPTENEEALRLYMLGRYHWGKKRDREHIQTAIRHFERAIELDPLFAKAHAGLADCYVLMSSVAYGSIPVKESMDRARAAARDALAIDANLSEAHTSLGIVKFRYDWDWEVAEGEFREAILLNPDYAPAHYWYSNLLVVTGRLDEALRESQTTKELDPFSPMSALNHGRVLYYARRYEEAAACFRQMLAAKPGDAKALYMLGLVLIQQRNYDEGIETLRKLYATDKLFAAAPLGYAYGKTGRRAEALGVVRELEEISQTANVPPQERAIIYAGMGERDEAFRLLEEAYGERFAGLINFTTEPIFDDLRPDPRYANLARRLNLSF